MASNGGSGSRGDRPSRCVIPDFGSWGEERHPPEEGVLALAGPCLPLPMLVTDARATVRYVNRAWTELTGLSPGASEGRGWLEAIDQGDAAVLVRRLTRERRGTGEYRVLGPDGWRWTRWWWHSEGGVRTLCLADIHDDRTREADLYQRATHDALTGLVNRSHFLELVERAVRRTARSSRRAAVVYLDLDGFKRVNDTGGHLSGDRVLATVGKRLEVLIRPPDVVARVGGDEFAVLCESVGGWYDAGAIAKRLEKAFQDSFATGERTYRISAAVGMALSEGPTDDAEALLTRADQEMYQSKRGGLWD